MKRIYLSVLFTVVGSLILIGWVLDLIAQNEYAHQLPTELQLYELIVQGAARQLDQVPFQALSEKTAALSKEFGQQLVLEPAANLALPNELQQDLADNGKLILQSNDGAVLFVTLKQHPNMLLQLNINQLTPGNENLEMMLTLALYIGVGICLALWLLPLTTRLSILSRAADSFGAGKLQARVAPSRFSYIKDLELNFNRMASQIETLVADNKLLAESLSHDLRTPVSCLRFGIEAAIDTSDEQKRATYLERVEEELTRMEEMLNAFLSYASMEQKAKTIVLQDVDLMKLLTLCIGEIEHLAIKHNVTINLDCHEPTLPIKIDGHWIQRALSNLLTNAIHYANSTIEIVVNIKAESVSIEVHDDGPGVPHEKWDGIFTPFVTVESSRNRQTNSFGLGLAIVSRVIHWHKGSVTITDSARLNGACFTLLLPKH